jgi:hypothetical protein
LLRHGLAFISGDTGREIIARETAKVAVSTYVGGNPVYQALLSKLFGGI